jgi:hypothetical protein
VRAAAGSISTTGSSRKESAVISIQSWYKYKKKKSITSTPKTTMPSTTKNKYGMLFSNSIPLGDEEIKQESSTLSESDRGTKAKGSPEFSKNHHRATLGTSTKFITLSALTSSGITTEIEEEGVINTSDISIMFQQCGQATKQLKEIVTKYDYVKAIGIPVYADASKPASGGRWSTKTINILENPTLVTLDHVKVYSGNMFRLTPVNSPARQTQVWFLESVRN